MTEVRSERFGRYALLRELGAGGQGVVWLAEDERLKRVVALKLLAPSTAGPDGELPPRVQREIEAVSRLDHPGICVVHEAGQIDGRPYLAMRYVEGETLADRLQRGESAPSDPTMVVSRSGSASEGVTAAAPDQAVATNSATRAEIARRVELVEKVANIVEVAHRAGVVHRDLKPANVMITPEHEPVVMDFGLARSEGTTVEGLTQTGDLLGTPAYMAPEALRDGESGAASIDVWALGVMLYEVATGVRPFSAPTYEGLMKQVLEEEATDPRRVAPAVSRDLVTIIATALSKEASRRYLSAADLAEDLRRLREHEPIQARPVGALGRSLRWARRHPARAALAVGLVVVALGAVIVAAVFADLADREREARSDADVAARSWKQALEEVEQLSDGERLEGLVARAARLWPEVPERLPAMVAWIDEAEELAERLPALEESLLELRARAQPWSDADRQREHPELFERLARDEATWQRLDELAREATGKRKENVAAYRDGLGRVIASTKRKAEGLTGHRFATLEAQWKHDVLARLVNDLRRFVGEAGLLADVRARARVASTLGARSIEAHGLRWEKARREVLEDARMRGLELSPQVGLVPLGADPDSGLQEFLHLRGHEGPLPERDAQGRLAISEDTGIILVLLPGGSFWMGAQADDAAGQNHDPGASKYEAPVHQVALDPFFISKYEVSQAWWQRMAGKNPSRYEPGFSRPGLPSVTLKHPVEQITYDEAKDILARFHLRIPTEAQWEFAARGGTATPFWTGRDRDSLRGLANLADAAARRGGATWRSLESWPDLDDGWNVHAPIDAMRPNPYGLHHVHGNLWEWCREWFVTHYRVPFQRGDGERIVFRGTGRVLRGGSFDNTAQRARVSNRYDMDPAVRNPSIGVRPARSLDRAP